MGDGSRKRIEEIEVGEEVITHAGRPRRVSSVHRQGLLPTLRIKTHRPAVAAASCLVAVVGVAGCTASAHKTPVVTATSTAVSAQPTLSVPPVEIDPGKPLSMPDRQKVLYRTEGRRGSANLTVLPQIPRGTLGIVVLCNGPGRIVVHLGSIASFPSGCDSGPGVYNEIALGSAKKSVAVSVTGSASNEWALTLGWTSVIDSPAG
jgi:hypothetical protein